MTPPPMPAGSPAAIYFSTMGPSGYMAFVKVLEIIGGLLVAFPRTRSWGLLVLGPIIINILAFHLFINKGATLIDPVNILISALALFLLWSERKTFAGLLR